MVKEALEVAELREPLMQEASHGRLSWVIYNIDQSDWKQELKLIWVWWINVRCASPDTPYNIDGMNDKMPSRRVRSSLETITRSYILAWGGQLLQARENQAQLNEAGEKL